MCGVEVVFRRFVARVLVLSAAISLPADRATARFSAGDACVFAAIGIGLRYVEVELPESGVTALSLRLYSAGPGTVYSNGL
jgi:hypothetical protein